MTACAQIVCRTDAEGGDLDPVRAWTSVSNLRGTAHIIVLIHGYNDTEDEARGAYQAFCQLQAAIVRSGLDWTFGATVVEVFWPGDARWGIARPAYYPWALPVADKTAALLSDIVRDLCAFGHGELVLDLVAHSMGNRIALGLLSSLQRVSGLQVRRSIHMAAAVPTWRLEKTTDEFALGLSVETARGEATSLYSPADAVLAYAFPVGETADLPDEGFLPVALGHQQWTAGHSWVNLAQWSAYPAGHGDYWSGKPVNAQVTFALDLGAATPRIINAYDTPTAAELDERNLDTRTIPTRSVGNSIDAPECECGT